MWHRRRARTRPEPAGLDLDRIRAHFDFPAAGRVVTNNAASTQPPRELVELLSRLTWDYENVHRGQSTASRSTTRLFEESFDTVATWLNAPDRRSIALYRNTTEAINAVMYSLLTQVRDGDNVVSTLMEHNSNFVPWHGMCREILPAFGRRVECRLARFDRLTGELDLDHLASIVDARTKLVAVTGASNFLGTKPPLALIRAISAQSGYQQPSGRSGSLLLVDAAQLVPSAGVDVRALDLDYLAFSFHKLLAPFGVGALYAKEDLLAAGRPFLYGGDMIAEGQVAPDRVAYNDLPWKYAAGTPNILGTIVSAQALRLVVDLVEDGPQRWFRTDRPLTHDAVQTAMHRVNEHTSRLTEKAATELLDVPGLRLYGPPPGAARSPLLAFNVSGLDPFAIAEGLDREGVEARAGCHCATLAHHDLGLDPPASCRLSFALYSSEEDVERATDAVRSVVRRLRRSAEHHHEDGAAHQEARSGVGDDAQPRAAEAVRRVGLVEGSVDERHRHAPGLVQVVEGEQGAVRDHVGPTEDCAGARQQQSAEHQLLGDRGGERVHHHQCESDPVAAEVVLHPVGEDRAGQVPR
jgi:cysteine desulfurase/selenocysteine lyase